MKGFAAAVAIAGLVSCSRPQPPLPVLGPVPAFTLTAEDGAPFSSQSLSGQVWIADFIFTRCPGPCLRMSAKMRAIQDAFRDDPSVQCVSFTVDPARDTPAVLAAYARRYQADPTRWRFLTGPQAELNRLSNDVFHLGEIVGDLNHSTRLIVIDRQMRIRAYVSSDEPDVVARVVDVARRVAQGR